MRAFFLYWVLGWIVLAGLSFVGVAKLTRQRAASFCEKFFLLSLFLAVAGWIAALFFAALEVF